ncbi:MAG: hypothetical protein A2511_05215, partial [Deltaproteobacteria bacterium RIFOXYD12_FULL_50_9]
MDRKRLEELLSRLKETMVKRKDCCWDDEKKSWIENALQEHSRHPFHAIITRNNPETRPEILAESKLTGNGSNKWDIPHGRIVPRKAPEMTAAIEMMLSRCRWIKFIDPHISPSRPDYKTSLQAFLTILANERPVGPPAAVEIHTGLHGATGNFLKKAFELLIPAGLTVTLVQWQERPGGQRLHNRYILSDLGGVSFHHGLDTGADGETDDITRLDREQYELHCKQYDRMAPAFDDAASSLVITGKLEKI